MNVPVTRFHPDEILDGAQVTVSSTDTRIGIREGGRTVTPAEVRTVWYRRPVSVRSDASTAEERYFEELEGRALLEGFYERLQCPWYSGRAAIQRARIKLEQLRVASDLGFSVPPYILTNDPEVLEAFLHQHKQCVIKPLAVHSALVKGETHDACLRPRRLEEHLIDQLRVLKKPPLVFAQKLVERDSELRVTAIGQEVHPVRLATGVVATVDSRDSWGEVKSTNEKANIALRNDIHAFLAAFRLNYGAFDFIQDKSGQLWFLECNGNGQFAWLDEDAKTNLVQVMAEHLALVKPPLFGGSRQRQ